jgi:hypothetical protein
LTIDFHAGGADLEAGQFGNDGPKVLERSRQESWCDQNGSSTLGIEAASDTVDEWHAVQASGINRFEFALNDHLERGTKIANRQAEPSSEIVTRSERNDAERSFAGGATLEQGSDNFVLRAVTSGGDHRFIGGQTSSNFAGLTGAFGQVNHVLELGVLEGGPQFGQGSTGSTSSGCGVEDEMMRHTTILRLETKTALAI